MCVEGVEGLWRGPEGHSSPPPPPIRVLLALPHSSHPQRPPHPLLQEMLAPMAELNPEYTVTSLILEIIGGGGGGEETRLHSYTFMRERSHTDPLLSYPCWWLAAC